MWILHFNVILLVIIIKQCALCWIVYCKQTPCASQQDVHCEEHDPGEYTYALSSSVPTPWVCAAPVRA